MASEGTCSGSSIRLLAAQDDREIESEEKPCPYIKANWMSKISIWWITSLITKGFRRRLHKDDIYDVVPSEQSERLTANLVREWSREKKEKSSKASLLSAIFHFCRKEIILSGLMAMSLEVSKLFQPFLIGFVLSYLEGIGAVSRRDAYILAGLVVLSSLLFSIPYTGDFHLAWTVGMRGRAALSALIYRKVLGLSVHSLRACTSGWIVNLMATDVETVDICAREFHFLWLSPLVILVVIILLFVEFGQAFCVGCGTMFVLLLLEAVVGVFTGRMKQSIIKWTDRRNIVMNEILGAMQMIKTFCWEKSFAQLVQTNRSGELKALFKSRMIESRLKTIYFLSHKVIAFATVATAVAMGQTVTTVQAVKLIGWLEFARTMAYGLFPLSVISFTEMNLSLKRIQKFLDMPEKEESSSMALQKTAFDILKLCKDDLKKTQMDRREVQSTVGGMILGEYPDIAMTGMKAQSSTHGGQSAVSATRRPWTSPHGYSIILNDIEVHWVETNEQLTEVDEHKDASNGSFGLKKLSMQIKRGELVAVVGPVGCGKTSLLMALLGEMNLKSGSVTTEGSLAYVPQEPWILSNSIKQNILLGKAVDQQYYSKVIEACCLRPDLQAMPRGDQTLVGERGWTLSGGQKTRLSIARAIYGEDDIYLLDDPLSSVDASVAKNLFNRCIVGLLGNKTRILVTHQLQFLPRADRVIIMDKGAIVACGTFEEVSQTEAFSDLKGSNQSSRPVRQRTLQPQIKEYAAEAGIEELYLSNQDHDQDQRVSRSGLEVWVKYINSGSGYIVFTLFWLFLALMLTTYIGCDWILVRWSSLHVQERESNVTSEYMLDFLIRDNRSFLLAWTGLLVVVIVTSELQSTLFFMFSVSVSRTVHKKAFNRVMRAPLRFFETNPIGRILNRFSRDTEFMDIYLPRVLYVAIGVLSTLVAQSVFVVVVSPWLALATLPLLVVMVLLQRYSIGTITDLRRIEALRRAPLYSLLVDTVRGLPVVRAMNKEEYFTAQFNRYQDSHTSAWFLFFGALRWLGVRAEWTMITFMAVCLFVVIAVPSVIVGGPGNMGLGLAYLAFIVINLQTVLRLAADVQTLVTSVERLCQYHYLDQEAPDLTDVTPPIDWPSNGEITMQEVYVQYTTDGSQVLKNININIKRHERIGIVGRTGAGKSTLMKCLLRLVEPQGSIIIDGVDISQIGLNDLRSNISVIPQDPIFMAGNLTKNLDPFEEHTDEDIWKVLQQVHMEEAIRSLPGSLSCEVLESGCNFSVGEKQLLCLARAILRKSSILLVDEATANVDNRTDEIVRETIRARFQESTVLTIAHRLNTIMDSDRVLVLSEGRVVEFDQPYFLLQDPHSQFYQLVKQAESVNMPDLVQ